MDRSAIESRNAWLRWIESPDSTQRLEVRLADSCASPYVVLAVLLRALQESESFVTAPSARGPATSLAEALTRYETAGWALGALSDEVRQLIRDGAERDLRGSLQWVTDRERQQHGLD